MIYNLTCAMQNNIAQAKVKNGGFINEKENYIFTPFIHNDYVVDHCNWMF